MCCTAQVCKEPNKHLCYPGDCCGQYIYCSAMGEASAIIDMGGDNLCWKGFSVSPSSDVCASTNCTSSGVFDSDNYSAASSALPCAGSWEQCGGIGFTGPSCCQSGLACTYNNDWYSQCLPSADKPSPSPSRTPQLTQRYCGGGSRGNGLCADSSLCCSKWGWCGTGSLYCGGTAPSPSPSPSRSPALLAPSSTPSRTKAPSSSPSPSPASGGACAGKVYVARLTWYESYPDPNSEECVKYSGCEYRGQFAGVDGVMSEEWVKAHRIVAVHEKQWEQLKLKYVRVTQGSQSIVAQVLDYCADSDCDGCCTQNGYGPDSLLIDMEHYTAVAFQASGGDPNPDGQVDGTVAFVVCSDAYNCPEFC